MEVMRLSILVLLCCACAVEDVERVAVAEDPQTSLPPAVPREARIGMDGDPGTLSAAPVAQDTLTLGVWNLHKRTDAVAARQLARLAEGADLLAIQEATSETPLPDGFGAHHAGSFRWSPVHPVNGVLTAARHEPLATRGFLSPARELGLTTPKSALVSHHALPDGRVLALVNVHAMLTDLPSTGFDDQLDVLVAAVLDHEGPLVLCGDLNTWSRDRVARLTARTDRLGLSAVALPAGVGTRLRSAGPFAAFVDVDPTSELDRVYVRGLTVREARWMPELDASDHVPIRVVFGLEDPGAPSATGADDR